MLAIGEAKHSTQRRTLADVRRLERVRQLLEDKGAAARGAKLLLFSVGGFDRNLLAATADRADVELVDLDRIYHGS